MCKSECIVVGNVCCMECKYYQECKHPCGLINLGIIEKDNYRNCNLYREVKVWF